MIESNKLMAKFLGWEYHNSQDLAKIPKWINNGKKICTNHEQLKFHSDWNWLMQVVEKIESLRISVSIYNKQCEIGDSFFEKIHINICHQTKIQAVYSACLQFIKNESNS